MDYLQGWGNPRSMDAKTKFHYFTGGKSLCDRWFLISNEPLDDNQDEHSDNCAICRKRVVGHRATKSQEAEAVV